MGYRVTLQQMSHRHEDQLRVLGRPNAYGIYHFFVLKTFRAFLLAT